MLITEEYRKLNEQLHASRQDYGTCSARWAVVIAELKKISSAETVLDYGCGKGLLAQSLQFPIREYDPAIEGKTALPEPADIVVCTDVLEHIEPACMDSVLDHLQKLTRHIGFFTIALRPAKKLLPDGRNTHVSLMPSNWWLGQMLQRFTITRWVVVDQGEVLVFVEAFGVRH